MGSLTALLVFAFFSYPFSVLPYLIVFVFLIAATAGEGNAVPFRPVRVTRRHSFRSVLHYWDLPSCNEIYNH
jgi:hypothetical protein